MADYNYTIATETLNGVVDAVALQAEILLDVALAAKFVLLQLQGGIWPLTSPTTIVVTFSSALTVGEEANLDIIVGAHTGVAAPEEDRKSFDEDLDLLDNDIYNVDEINGTVFDTLVSDANTHIANTNNPHSVTAVQAGAIPDTEKGAANGVAPLDGSSLIPTSVLPDLAVGGDLSGTVSNATVTDLTLSGEAQGAIPYNTGAGWSALPPGSANQFLRTNGAGQDPEWASLSFANSYTVAKGGEGDFSTLEAALAVANPLSGSDPQAIFVYPGTYQENPLTVNTNITIEAQGRVIIEAIDANNPLFTLDTASRLRNLNYIGPTNDTCVTCASGAQFPVVEGGLFISGAVGLQVDEAGMQLVGRDFQMRPGITNSFIANEGAISATGFADFSTNGAEITGASGFFSISSCRFLGNTVALFADDGASIVGIAIKVDDCGVAIRTGTLNPSATSVKLVGFQVFDANDIDIDQQGVGTSISIANGFLSSANIQAVDHGSLSLFYLDQTSGENAVEVVSELHVGSVEHPSEFSSGQGDSTARGMVVLTTDNTTTSVSDGGNITDVSTEAASTTGSTFTFQGLGAGHSIIVGLDRELNGNKVKHWGLKVNQTLAAVLGAGNFVFERWDGAAWTAFNIMAVEDTLNYRYADQIFLRPNSTEQIRYGLTEDNATWAQKTIDGRNLYWVRIRITSLVTTLPVFQRFKAHTSRLEITEFGAINHYGQGRYRQIFLTSGNVFGESGGVVSFTFNVGSGGAPTGWAHTTKNSELNGTGDAIYFQLVLPRGIDTSLPLSIRMIYIPTLAGLDPPTIVCSMIPVEVQGTLIANPLGGITPIPRTLLNTQATTATVAQTRTTTVDATTTNQVRSVVFEGFDVSAYYEGDLILIRIELDDDGLTNANLGIIAPEVSYGVWSPGEIV